MKMYFKKMKEHKIRSDIKIKVRQNKILKEQNMFLALCSDIDKALILDNKEIDLINYERLSFLIEQLGFDNFAISFNNKHHKLLEQSSNQILENIKNDNINILAELKQHEKWIQDFIEQLPTSEMKRYIFNIFNI